MKHWAPAVALYVLFSAHAVGQQLLVPRNVITRITVTRGDLRYPVELTDPAVVQTFDFPRTLVRNGIQQNSGFIVEWSEGPADVRQPPPYTVSFYGTRWRQAAARNAPAEELIYVVGYYPRPDASYVYFPKAGDYGYSVNLLTSISRQEGRWFPANAAWRQAVDQLIAEARGALKAPTLAHVQRLNPASRSS